MAWLLALLLIPVPLATTTSADDPSHEDTGAVGTAGAAIAGVQGEVDTLVTPTSGAPSFVLDGEIARLELRGDVPVAVQQHATLTPSFGDGPSVQAPIIDVAGPQASERWEGPYAMDVTAVEIRVPAGTPAGLYDVALERIDSEPRAISVLDAWPETLEMVLLADTQTGDPRAITDGVHEGTGVDPLAPHETDPEELHADPEPIDDALAKTLGISVTELHVDPSDRWAAYRAAIEQINELEPDLVLFSGDLTFGQLVPASYHVEYEEAWALINGGEGVDGTTYEGIHAPTLLSPGNHDGYAANGEDGLAFWMAYFGPPAYSVEVGERTFVSVNTYDWSEMDRLGASYAVSAWGGQVRDAQLAWLRATLCEANGGTPLETDVAIAGVACMEAGDEPVVTFSHHSPSWEQDPWKEQYDGAYETCGCEGTPVLEQFARGLISFTTTGQGWSGDNRLAVRDTLREFDVDLHAAGHTHRDRIARDVGHAGSAPTSDGDTVAFEPGDIVEVPQKHRDGLDVTRLQLVNRTNAGFELDQQAARQLLRDGTGPLYLETTTAASDTDQYFGYRPVTWHPGQAAFPAEANGIAPFETGVDMTEDALAELAGDPGRWNATHSELGLFSVPTFGAAKG